MDDKITQMSKWLQNELECNFDKYGPATTTLLQNATDIEETDSVMLLAQEIFLSYPHSQVPEHWRLLYADSCIKAGLITLDKLNTGSKHEDLACQAIERLDKALIVAGPPYPRDEYIHSLIKDIQELVANDTSRDSTSSSKKRKTLPSSFILEGNSLSPPYMQNEIPRYDQFPSLDTPDEPLSRPFIVNGALNDWPALNDRAWDNPCYISTIAGQFRIVPVEIGSSYTLPDWTQKIIPFEDFLTTIIQVQHEESSECKQQPMYLAQHDLFRQFPALLNDTITPDLVYSAPDAPKYFPTYEPVSNEMGFSMNAWFGPSGTTSPAHTDPYYNCYAQVVGRKWVWVAPPHFQNELYPYGLYPEKEQESVSLDLMQNTSQVDVTNLEDCKSKYPIFYEHVLPQSMQTVLKPGDLLFLPPKWWHAMKSLDTSFSVSYWF